MTMKKYSGYTLIELMVALAILSVLVSVGLPQVTIFFKGNRMVANPIEMLSGLNIARSEAIKRNSRVSICKSANASDASPSCTTEGGWDQGWFVFVEGAGTSVGEYTAADVTIPSAILRVNTGAEGSNVTITADSPIDNYVSFTSRGAPKLENGASQSGVFRICDDRGLANAAGNAVARGVVLNASGRARITKNAAKIGVCP